MLSIVWLSYDGDNCFFEESLDEQDEDRMLDEMDVCIFILVNQ